MLRLFCIALLSLLSATVFADADAILGTWLTEDGDARVKIYKVNDIYYGKIIWLKEPIDPDTGEPWLDKENEDPAKRDKPILGSKIIWGFEYEDGEYIDGKVYDSRNGATFSGKMWLEDNNSLKMRGYWGFFYATETWTRVE